VGWRVRERGVGGLVCKREISREREREGGGGGERASERESVCMFVGVGVERPGIVWLTIWFHASGNGICSC
jgi:hypothetical protein